MWRIILDNPCDAYTNMARDEAILISKQQADALDTIRFYSWDKPSISLGYFQKCEKEINIENCAKSQIPIVRRITGGRAVFHDKEITYSIIASENNPLLSKNIRETFYSISKCLLAGLKLLGVDAQIISRPSSTTKVKNPICFNSTSWHEIAVNGKKIVGTAQSKKRGIILHQGSILLNFSSGEMVKYFNIQNSSLQEMENNLEKNITAIEKVLCNNVILDTVIQSLINGFIINWHLKYIIGELSENEKKIEIDLLEKKYLKSSWNIKGLI